MNLNYKQKLIVGVTLLVVACLIVTSVFVYYEYYEEEEPIEEELPDTEIDDRISPLTTQAVFFEVNRIRKKGIIDQVMNSGSNILKILPIRNVALYTILDGLLPGRGWDKKPIFDYVIVLDGYKWRTTKEFETWDTDYINYELFRRVEEEKPTVDIGFKLIDINKKLFSIKESDADQFNITYDFRTGRWSGDDEQNDSDGYGHFNGTNYEVWFSVKQTDYDADGIPYWTEVNILGTDPTVDDSELDPDDDGIPTTWEWKWGYDPFKKDNHSILDPDDDGLQNTEEYFMEKWLANPYYPEIYIEADYMERTPLRPFELRIEQGKLIPITRPRFVRTNYDGTVNIFQEEAQQLLIDRFNLHGISVHIDDGCMGGGGEEIPFIPSGAYDQETGFFSEYYKNNFDDDRKGIFRYLITAHSGGFAYPNDYKHYYDFMTCPSNTKFYAKYLSFALSARAQSLGRAMQVMHELGHTCGYLGNHSAGVDNTSSRYGNSPDYPWYDYVSCMNYDYFALRYFDYSDGTHGEYDTDDWAEIDLGFFQRPSIDMEGLGAEDFYSSTVLGSRYLHNIYE